MQYFAEQKAARQERAQQYDFIGRTIKNRQNESSQEIADQRLPRDGGRWITKGTFGDNQSGA